MSVEKKYPQLILKKGRERSLRLYHPWVYSGAVETLPKAQTGEIIEIMEHSGKSIGFAFYDGESQIVARVFEFSHLKNSLSYSEEGAFAYWKQKIQKALQLRKSLGIISADNHTYRLLHAEGDFAPGIIADVYNNDTVVLQLRTNGSSRLAQVLTKALNELGFPNVYLKNKNYTGQAVQNSALNSGATLSDGWLSGEKEVEFSTLENGLAFTVNIATGQKTGFFIDQRENRAILGKFSEGKKVLNTFAYSGGFSVYALEGGAREVHSVDISKEAVALAEKNVRVAFPEANHKAIAADCFDFLKNADEDYDIIVLDPPAFAKSIRAKDNAARGYKELNMLGIKKVKPGGLVFTFSCSQVIDKDLFRKIVFGAAADVNRTVRVVEQLTQPADHPINIYHPEGEYLKGLILYVE